MEYVPARKVFTSRGELLITERGGCCDGEEIAAIDDFMVPAGTRCDICEEIIPVAAKQEAKRRKR